MSAYQQLQLWDDTPGYQVRRDELRRQVFDHYGRSCACCGSREGLTIDHVDGSGARHRRELFGEQIGGVRFYAWLKRQGWPDGYQIYCHPCNRSKGSGPACRLDHRQGAA